MCMCVLGGESWFETPGKACDAIFRVLFFDFSGEGGRFLFSRRSVFASKRVRFYAWMFCVYGFIVCVSFGGGNTGRGRRAAIYCVRSCVACARAIRRVKSKKRRVVGLGMKHEKRRFSS